MIRTDRLTVRRAKAQDWRAYQAVWAAVAQTEYAQYDVKQDTDEETVKRKLMRWAGLKDDMDHMFLSVCLGDHVIGYMDAHRDGNEYEIGYCFHPDYHGKGYARESIGAVLDEMKKQGVKRVTAGTGLKNTPSVKLLGALGFTQIATEQVSFYRDENGDPIYFDGGIFERVL